jgi:asparaginyl-tRNA synthetase
MAYILLSEIEKNLNKEVLIKGWVFNFRSSGSLFFLQIRDGFGEIQAVVSKKEVVAQVFELCQKLTIESSVEVAGRVYKEAKSPTGYEIRVKDLKIFQVAEDYPIAKKEHGTEFLMDHRHLWVRSKRQRLILSVRGEVIWQLRKFFKEKNYVLIDTPILTPTSCEETTTLFKTDYFGDKAYLSQSGQLYLEALIFSFGHVYDFGPTFRAEKSKTRRHLTEFWMLDAEAAFMDFEESLKLQEKLVSYVVQNVIKIKEKELKELGRDLEKLKKIVPPFETMSYDEAIERLNASGSAIGWGRSLGADDETVLSQEYEKPLFIHRYPAKSKAFYMKPDPDNPEVVLCADLLATEGYGELIGGSQRIDDYKQLEQKIKEFKLNRKNYEWYLDLRKYGSVPHSGFGLGLERLVAWICGLDHVRETIPFPRLLNRLRP